jgi:hypothetical protein
MITATVALVLFIFTFTVASPAYPYDIASARKLITGNHISTSYSTNCDGDVCQMQVCVNNKCHGSNPNQGSNSTVPWTDNDQ